jgi:hypothetical protein
MTVERVGEHPMDDRRGLSRMVSEAGIAGRLRDGFRGELLQPGDDGYETARRIWNGAIDKRPGLIARL